MQTIASIKAAISRTRQRIFRTRAEDSLPHIVTHQRVYIVPTKRGLAFVLSLLLMLVASVNYALSLGYALCFILTGLFAATLLHTYRNLAGLEVHDIDVKNSFAGEKMAFIISIANRLNDTRHGIRVSTDQNIAVMTHIDSQDSSRVTLSIPTTVRGFQKLGRITLQSDWPLGLWTCWTYLHVPAKALVYPKPEHDAPELPMTKMSAQDGKKAAGVQGDISGLREYRPGDSIGSVAWKSAAKGLGLQVRTFEENFAPSNVLLNLNDTGQSTLEDQLSRLCAWALQANASKVEFGLQLPGQNLASSRGEMHFKNTLETLATYGIRQ